VLPTLGQRRRLRHKRLQPPSRLELTPQLIEILLMRRPCTLTNTQTYSLGLDGQERNIHSLRSSSPTLVWLALRCPFCEKRFQQGQKVSMLSSLPSPIRNPTSRESAIF